MSSLPIKKFESITFLTTLLYPVGLIIKINKIKRILYNDVNNAANTLNQ